MCNCACIMQLIFWTMTHACYLKSETVTLSLRDCQMHVGLARPSPSATNQTPKGVENPIACPSQLEMLLGIKKYQRMIYEKSRDK